MSGRWEFQDIQELKLAPDHIHLLTYWDNKWRLGADREFDFSGKVPGELYAIWKESLDHRFVAEIARSAGEAGLGGPGEAFGTDHGIGGDAGNW